MLESGYSRTRARIRHRLLPFLQQEFDPQPSRTWRSGGLRARGNLLARVEDERFAALASREPSGAVSLRIADLLSPLPMFGQHGDAKPERDPLLHRPRIDASPGAADFC